MPWAIYGAFFFTVALLFLTAYFLLGGLPLLILKHDVPLDAKFVRAFFNVNYRVSFWAALGAALSYALWGRAAFAAGAVGIAAIVALMSNTCSARWTPRVCRSRAATPPRSAAFAACTLRRS